jgi:anti-anti-sigma regulatory factor
VDQAYAQRLEAYLENLYLMATTFSALSLSEQAAIGDTLLSLVASFLERGSGALLGLTDAEPVVLALRGDLEEASLLSGRLLWQALAAERVAQIVPAARAALSQIAAFAGGLASVAITIDDHPVALLVLGATADEGPFRPADLSFLTAAAGIGALALTSAAAVRAQKDLTRSVEQVAASARREADAKASLLQELDRKLSIIDRQHREIIALSTPILQVGQGVLLVPIIGTFDAHRGAEILPSLLGAVVERRARAVIIDLTAVEVVGARDADQILRLITAVKLLGARPLITGVQPAVARVIAELGVDLSAIVTLQSVEQALLLCAPRGAEPIQPRT